MTKFPISKYRFYTATKVTGEPYKVIAVSTYCGKPVRGVATCSKNDVFDLNKGMRLAAARCNAKIAERRKKRASQKVTEAQNAAINAMEKLTDMNRYLSEATLAEDQAFRDLYLVLEKMRS